MRRGRKYTYLPHLLLVLVLAAGLFVTAKRSQAAPGTPVYAWGTLGSGFNGTVYALAFDSSGNLYVGGDFTTVEGYTVNYIAVRDSISGNWLSLGGGMNGGVAALAFDSAGNLYAGGGFTTAGAGVPANRVAKWNGSTWSALGNGVNDVVLALAADASGNVYAGGGFTSAGGNPASVVAQWDGSSWSAMGDGFNWYVYALLVDPFDDLYAGGGFDNSAGVPFEHIAGWDGSAWNSLAGGLSRDVQALALDAAGIDKYAGGGFTHALDSGGGSIEVNRVARWDQAHRVWLPLGSGVDNWVHSLTVDNAGNLYAGGDFSTAGGNPANRVAVWDGTTWSAMGAGIDGRVYALAAESGGDIYAGGDFTTAGGISANRIAVWDEAPEVVSVDITEMAITVVFSEDMYDPAGDTAPDDVTNLANYLVYRDGADGSFETVDCAGGVAATDVPVTITSVSYDSGTYTVSLTANLQRAGNYKIRVCGTTSLVDSYRIPLAGDGLASGTDYAAAYAVAGPVVEPVLIPDTGFAPLVSTTLPAQPRESAYAELRGLWLDIPRLGLQMPVVGVPLVGGEWDVAWLGSSAGWLEGTAYPTWEGNTVLTAHVWNAWGNPGPFRELRSLAYGDRFSIHSGEMVYTYEVRTSQLIRPDDLSVLDHAEHDLVTLLTCESYNIWTGEYRYRRAVTAVLVEISE